VQKRAFRFQQPGQEAGYYDEAGLEVTFQNKIDPEALKKATLTQRSF